MSRNRVWMLLAAAALILLVVMLFPSPDTAMPEAAVTAPTAVVEQPTPTPAPTPVPTPTVVPTPAPPPEVVAPSGVEQAVRKRFIDDPTFVDTCLSLAPGTERVTLTGRLVAQEAGPGEAPFAVLVDAKVDLKDPVRSVSMGHCFAAMLSARPFDPAAAGATVSIEISRDMAP
jgi:hypothetical protein